MITLLKDVIEDEVDAIIISTKTDSRDIEVIISKVKNKNPGGWTGDDIVNVLPDDCELYWCSDLNSIWY